MKTLIIEDKKFNIQDIKQLYPAVLVKTGYKDEITPMSLEWIDNEAKNRVEIAGYALFITLDKDNQHSFVYNSREELDRVISIISRQVN